MNIYSIEMKRLFRTLILWSCIMILIISLYMSFFPSVSNSDMSELMKAKIDVIPPAIRDALGIENMVDFSDLLQYFAYIDQFILIAACIFAAILGSSALIKEESEGTIEFLYAKPVSRASIVTSKLLSVLSILLLFNIIMFATSVIFFEAFKPPGYRYFETIFNIYKSMLGVQLVFLAVGLAASTILPHYSQAVPVSLGIFFITYLLGTFSSVINEINWLEYFSPYHYAVPSSILKAGGSIKTKYLWLIFLISAASILYTYRRYTTKDMSI